jgi:hypothetical protein
MKLEGMTNPSCNLANRSCSLVDARARPGHIILSQSDWSASGDVLQLPGLSRFSCKLNLQCLTHCWNSLKPSLTRRALGLLDT